MVDFQVKGRKEKRGACVEIESVKRKKSERKREREKREKRRGKKGR